MSIERKVTARTGAAGVLVGAAITLGFVAFVSRSDSPPAPEKRTAVEVSSTTSSTVATTASTAPAPTVAETAPAVTAPPGTAPRAIDDRVTDLESRVDQLEDTTTTSTTVYEEPTTTAPENTGTTTAN